MLLNDYNDVEQLAEYFGVSEMFFYNLQQDINARNSKVPELMTA